MAFLLQVGEQQRQRPTCYAAPHLGYRYGRHRIFPRNNGQLPERHVYPGRMGDQTVIREILRRAKRGRRLRQRLLCRRAQRRRYGFCARNHRQDTVRFRQCAAGRGQQQLLRRRASHLDGHEPLRGHLPRSRADPHGKDRRIAPLPRLGRHTGAPELGRRRSGRRRSGDTPRHRRGEQLRPDARHHGARRQPRIFQTAEGAPRRETRHDSLLGRRPPVVEPHQPGPLPGIGEYRRRDRHRQRSRAYGFPQHRGDPGGRLCDQRHPHPDTRRNALPRQRHLGRRTHRARL